MNTADGSCIQLLWQLRPCLIFEHTSGGAGELGQSAGLGIDHRTVYVHPDGISGTLVLDRAGGPGE
jgi:hypothetical protein